MYICLRNNKGAEQSLEDYETCCLSELFLPNIESAEELFDIASLLYRVNKHSLTLPCHLKETEAIVHKNMRMGIGVTGYLQATEEQRSWLSDCYEKLREFDKEYSAAHGWAVSIKLTTTKPSGTLSLLPGVTAGVHPAYSKFTKRRIRFASNSPIVNTVRAAGYAVEYQRLFDGSTDFNTVVAEFPLRYPEGTTTADEISAIEQLEQVKRLQTEWSDNAVSCTVYYTAEELDGIKEYLSKNYNKTFKTLSFLRHTGHGFDQAPIEPITEEEYNALVAKTTVIESIEAPLEYDEDSDCSTGACPVR